MADGEVRSLRPIAQPLRNLLLAEFVDVAAIVADGEHRGARMMVMSTADEGIERFDPVRDALGDEAGQRPIDGRGRGEPLLLELADPIPVVAEGLEQDHLGVLSELGTERLDAAGTFASLGGVPANRAASCDGTTWTALGTGLDGAAEAIAWHTGGSAGTSEIFVAGSFANAGGNVAARVAAWRLCTDQASFCAGDGSFADHTTPCPCGNNGASGNGCGHSFGVQGANLSATGAPSLDDVVLHAQFEPANSFTLMMQHANTADTVFHDGVLCAGNPLVRLRGRSAAGGEAFFPNSLFAVDATTTLSQRGGVFPGQGVRRYYAAWYRNASTTFCPPATANVTNGWRIDW